MNPAPAHLMELPRKILIGDGVIRDLGGFILDLNFKASKIAIVTGRTVKARAGKLCRSSLDKSSLDCSWHIVTDASMDSVNRLQIRLEEHSPDFIIGLGGGRSVDGRGSGAYIVRVPPRPRCHRVRILPQHSWPRYFFGG